MIVKELVAKHAVNIENTTAVIGVATTALGAVAIGAWQPIAPMELIIAAAGGLLGGASYAYARKMKSAVTVVASVVLASAWCSFLAPIILHGAAMIYPFISLALLNFVILFGAAAIMGACGMTVYEGLLNAMDALSKALPERADELWRFFLDIISKRFGGGK